MRNYNFLNVTRRWISRKLWVVFYRIVVLFSLINGIQTTEDDDGSRIKNIDEDEEYRKWKYMDAMETNWEGTLSLKKEGKNARKNGRATFSPWLIPHSVEHRRSYSEVENLYSAESQFLFELQVLFHLFIYLLMDNTRTECLIRNAYFEDPITTHIKDSIKFQLAGVLCDWKL